jgi:hypothetical protein
LLVRGLAKLESDEDQDDRVMVQADVALEVHVVETSGGKEKIVLVKELTALPFDFDQGRVISSASDEDGKRPKSKKKTKKTASQGTDPAAKFVGDAAGDAAKKVLGF